MTRAIFLLEGRSMKRLPDILLPRLIPDLLFERLSPDELLKR